MAAGDAERKGFVGDMSLILRNECMNVEKCMVWSSGHAKLRKTGDTASCGRDTS